jgi:hypothetical protein
MRVCAIALLIVSLALPRPAHACSKRHQTVFELFDEAAQVAIVKVRAVTTSEAELGVVESLEGAKQTIRAKETNTSCHIGYRRGRRALVFVRADGWAAGMYEGYVTDYAAWLPILRRFAAATTPAERLAAVLDAIDAAEPRLTQDASAYLVDHPELLASIDRAAHDRITAAGDRAGIDSMLPALLLRIGDAQAAADLLAKRRFSRAKIFTRLRDHMRFEPITDAGALADAIRDATDDGDRIAALERCERVRAISLFPFTTYSHGVANQLWPALADACRSGTPVQR